MAYITLEEAKQHLNIEAGYNDEDGKITDLIEVAEVQLSKELCQSLIEFEDKNGILAAPLRQCILLLVGYFYANREAASPTSWKVAPLAYEHIVRLYRKYGI
ncbi:MAG: head-tail connector protein [Bacteroides sp.]